MSMRRVCMIVPNQNVQGGIATVTNGYRGSSLQEDYSIDYIESYRDGNKVEKLFKGLAAYCRFFYEMIFRKPDLVHIHTSFGMSFYRALPFILISRLFHVPVINHIHGADFSEFYQNASSLKKNIVRNTYNLCANIIVLSEEWKDLFQRIGIKSKINVLKNYASSVPNTWIMKPTEQNHPVVLFLGEIGRRKGGFDLPQIINIVSSKISNVEFVLAGSGAAPDVTRVKEAVTALGVSDNVTFPGWIRGQDKSKQLSRADLFLLPSYDEGMPMSILEAMGYSLPIVSTTVGGIPSLVSNDVNGQLCTPGDIHSLANAVISILESPQKEMKFSKNSFDRVKQSFSLEKHVDDLEKIYESNG